MRHQAFVHALAEYTPDQPEWQELCSGLLVLRQFDDWLAAGSPSTLAEHEIVARVREQIDAIPQTGYEVRALLETILDVLGRAGPAEIMGVFGPFLAYSYYLEYTKHRHLGEYVLYVIIEILDSISEFDDLHSIVGIYCQYGRVALRGGDLDSAEIRYTRALRLAERIGDDVQALQAKIYLSIALNLRHEFNKAERLLKTVVAAARKTGLTAIEAHALQVRGSVRQNARRFLPAFADLAASYALTSNPSMRESLLSDLASCVAEFGLWDAACAIHERLARTARNHLTRGIALINLLEAAVVRKDKAKYESVWHEIRTHYLDRLPSEFALRAEYYSAWGMECFCNVDDAVIAYQTIVSKAERLGTVGARRMAHERLDSLLPVKYYQA